MPQFTNETIDLGQLPNYQDTILTKPHPAYFKVISLNLLIFLLALALGMAFIFYIDPQIRKNLFLFLSAFAALALILFVLYWFSFKKRGYALRAKDIMYKSGIIAETTTIVPLNRIQHVALEEGVFSRLFKLGKLQIYTAGGQTGHLEIAGIPILQAKSIKEILLQHIDQIDNLSEGQS